RHRPYAGSSHRQGRRPSPLQRQRRRTGGTAGRGGLCCRAVGAPTATGNSLRRGRPYRHGGELLVRKPTGLERPHPPGSWGKAALSQLPGGPAGAPRRLTPAVCVLSEPPAFGRKFSATLPPGLCIVVRAGTPCATQAAPAPPQIEANSIRSRF